MASTIDNSWGSLKNLLSPTVMEGVKGFGFKRMTTIQASCIPSMLNYKDVVAQAVTGSGKTLAFLVPVVQLILRKEDPFKTHEIYSLIISPTRELATQIHEVLQKLLKFTPNVTSLLLCGGSNINQEMKQFQKNGGHVIVGTPGRIEDVFRRSAKNGVNFAIGCKALEILILDEADKLLEMGFSDTINSILAYLPKQRRTGLFSATQTSKIENLIRAGLRNPIKIEVNDPNMNSTVEVITPASLKNFYMIAEIDKKFSVLLSLLKENKNKKIIVFLSSCASVDYFFEMTKTLLTNQSVQAIHGKIKNVRFKIFDEFRRWKSGVLLCTDVMCRGVDIPQVELVIQFDPPSKAESFVHRCGRTARSGTVGSAILLLLPQEEDYVKFIELNQKVSLELMKTPENLPVLLPRMRRLQMKDRAIMEKGSRAYVSFVQFYLKHECSVLFQLKKLNMGLLAMGYGLLSLPKMPELRKLPTDDFVPFDFELNSVRYKDKQKEKSRLNKLSIFNETGKWPSAKANEHRQKQTVSWSKKKDVKTKRKAKKERKEQYLEKISKEDIDDMVNDHKMLKKFKKKKISDDDFDKHFGCTTDGEESEPAKKST